MKRVLAIGAMLTQISFVKYVGKDFVRITFIKTSMNAVEAKMGDKKNNYSLGLGSWMFIQCALLVIHYGFNKKLPLWALWLPSIVTGSIIIIVLVVFLVIIIAGAIMD